MKSFKNKLFFTLLHEICETVNLQISRGHPVFRSFYKRAAYHGLPPRRTCRLVPDHSSCTEPTHEKICTKNPVLTDIEVCEEIPKITCDQTPEESCSDVPVTVQRNVQEQVCY